jgi:hypothetical protein
MAEYIEREALMKRIRTHIKQITPIEENRDMFYHDSGINAEATGAWLEVKNAPAADVVSRSVLDQVRWERDVAIKQLEKHGIPFGGVAPNTVEVVRCEKCKRQAVCVFSQRLGEDGYCSDGERRNDI